MGKARLAIASVCISCLAWTSPGLLASSARAETSQATDACAGPQGSADAAITNCTTSIDSGALSGRQLAAAYAQRGFARTLKRDLAGAEQDLDQAIKIDPTFADGYVNRANFWNVSRKPDLALADAEQAVRLDPAMPQTKNKHSKTKKNLGNWTAPLPTIRNR